MARRSMPAMILLMALATCLPAGVRSEAIQLVEDPPSVAPAKAGDLTGILTPAETIVKLSAVSRVTGKRYQPAEFDRKTGRFRFAAMSGDASYDLCLTLADGRIVEGIDLAWFEARFLRLAEARRKQLGLPEPTARPATQADADELRTFIADREDFSDINRPLYIRLRRDKAVMLVERIRSRKFHAAKAGELIWRTDLFYFTRDGGGWQALPNVRRLVQRQRFTPEQWSKFNITYDHRLSLHLDPAGIAAPLRYAVPASPSPATSRLASSPLKASTKPVVLLDGEK